MRKLGALFLGPLLALALACGGGASEGAKPAPAATGLAYTDPSGTGWRLVRDASSTPTRLVLNLVGPTGLKTRGAGFNLLAPTTVKYGTFHVAIPGTTQATDFPIAATGVYELLNTDPRDPWTGDPIPNHPLEPTLLAGGVKPGHVLTVGIFQKDRRASAKESGQALARIALEFDPAAGLQVGDLLPLAILKARHQAEDIGPFDIHPTVAMAEKAHLVDMTLAVGVLRAN